MRKHVAIALAVLAGLLGQACLARAGEKGGKKVAPVLSFAMTGLAGKPVDLAKYQGKVVLIVNVASECGYTPQYKGLQALHDKYAGEGLAILGVPSNDFGAQEPGSPAEIQEFCRLTYGVTFPMFEKVVTTQGASQSPVYSFLGKSGNLPAWNFAKYLVDKNGKVVAFFPSQVTPESPELRAAIDKALAN